MSKKATKKTIKTLNKQIEMLTALGEGNSMLSGGVSYQTINAYCKSKLMNQITFRRHLRDYQNANPTRMNHIQKFNYSNNTQRHYYLVDDLNHYYQWLKSAKHIRTMNSSSSKNVVAVIKDGVLILNKK